jgi:hypothetical protein
MGRKRVASYDVKKFRELVEPLLKETNESYRQASMAAGLDETAISRYFGGTQPVRDACIALADHFGINPNKMLEAAGYEPLHFFDRRLIDPNALPPDVDAFANEIARIEDEEMRKEMIEAFRQILRIQMEAREAGIKEGVEQGDKQGLSPRATAAEAGG